jgi:hypothetical protein
MLNSDKKQPMKIRPEVMKEAQKLFKLMDKQA